MYSLTSGLLRLVAVGYSAARVAMLIENMNSLLTLAACAKRRYSYCMYRWSWFASRNVLQKLTDKLKPYSDAFRASDARGERRARGAARGDAGRRAPAIRRLSLSSVGRIELVRGRRLAGTRRASEAAQQAPSTATRRRAVRASSSRSSSHSSVGECQQ